MKERKGGEREREGRGEEEWEDGKEYAGLQNEILEKGQ